MRSVESLLVNKGMGRGRWTWRHWRATCRRASRRVPSPRTVGGQAAVFVNVLLQSNEDTRRHVMSVGAHGV